MFFRRADTLTIVLVVTATATVLPSSESDTTTTHYVYRTVLASDSTTSRTTSTSAITSAVSTISAVSSFRASAVSSPRTSASTTSTAMSASSLATVFGGLSGSSLSSSTLGLAIGIPLAVLSLCIIAALAWSFFHKRIARKSDETLKIEAFPKADMVDEVPNWQAIPAREDEKKPGIFNRLSKMINRSEWPGNSEFRSPLFLKRFHLLNENKAKNLPKLPDGELVRLVLSSEYLDVSDYVGRQFLVVRPYAKRLGDELLLCAGEKVIMKRVHPDGWATVEVGGGAGVVPLMCLKKC